MRKSFSSLSWCCDIWNDGYRKLPAPYTTKNKFNDENVTNQASKNEVAKNMKNVLEKLTFPVVVKTEKRVYLLFTFIYSLLYMYLL